MLNFTDDVVSELKQQVTCEDEPAIRERCGFRKDIARYPLLYKEKGMDGLLDISRIDYVAVVAESDIATLDSLLIRTEDGRWTRICAAFLKEMQSDDYLKPAEGEQIFEGSLFD